MDSNGHGFQWAVRPTTPTGGLQVEPEEFDRIFGSLPTDDEG